MQIRFRQIFTFLILLIGWACHAQVSADFIFDKVEGCGSLPVNFMDQSTSLSGSIVDWRWDLGGITSTKQNPGIIFTNPGQYTICLTVKTSTGATSTICKEKLINIYADPVANFSVEVQNTCAPAVVNFNDLSSTQNGGIATWIWDIGGSSNVITTSDSLLDIVTSYSSAGIYTGTLTVIDVKGCKNTITKPNILEVLALPILKVDLNILSSCSLPWKVKFNNLDPDVNTTYTWDFGNGQTFIGANPLDINYSESKQYDVSVIMSKGECKDTIVYKNLINTHRITGFEVLTTSLCEDQTILLKDTSNYVADSLKWEFGDGEISHELDAAHAYKNPGCYVVKLTKYIGACVLTSSHPCITILPKPIINYNIVNGNSCIVPANIKLQSMTNDTGVFKWKLYGSGINEQFTGSSHDYLLSNFGNYYVDLTFTSAKGCVLNNDSIRFDISKFEASLPYLGPANCVPYDAIISDSIVSNTPVVNWDWTIGNPPIFSSNLAKPIFMVKDTGRWDVSLIVTNAFGCKDTITRRDYIRGGIKPIVDFTADPLNGCISTPRQFTDLSSSFADRWIWEKNDTIFSFVQHPLYEFSDFGMYDINLIAFHNGCPSSKTKIKYIDVFKPKSQFKVDYRCDDPFTIDIVNQSVGADILYWVVTLDSMRHDTIRDSLLSTYTFPSRGIYFLTHFAKNFESGCEHIRQDSIFIVDLRGAYTLDTIRGCAPLDVNISTILQDAVTTEYLAGQFTISYPPGQPAIATFNEGGLITGPKMLVTDRHGCKDTFQSNIPVEVSKLSAQILASDVTCIPNQEQFFDQSIIGLTPIITRRWSFSAGNQSSDEKDPFFDVNLAGSFEASLYIEDTWGCKDSITKPIQGITLIPLFSADTLSCTSRGIRFKMDSDATYLSEYQWDFGDGKTSTEKNPLHTYSQEGIYSVCVEMFDSRGCSKRICKDSFITIRNPVSIFSGSPLDAPCPPLLTNFINQSLFGTSYAWDFGDNSGLSYNRDPAHVYTKPGNFPVTLYTTMIPGCVDTLIKIDFVNLNGPTADLNFTIEGNCTPLLLNMNAKADKEYSFIWDYGDGNIEAIPTLVQSDTTVYAYDLPGSYVPKLLVTDSAGCARTFTIDPIVVNEIKPAFIIDKKAFCSATAEVNLTNNTTSSSGDVAYYWAFEGIKSYTSVEKNPTLIMDGYGKYNVTLIANTTNCVDTLTMDSIVEISAIPIPSFQFQTNHLCANTGIEIKNNSTSLYGNIATWQWKINDSFISQQREPLAVFAVDGLNTISLVTTTEKGCIDSTNQSVIIKPNTLISLIDNHTICIGDSIDIFAIVDNNALSYTFEWYNDPTLDCKTCLKTNVKPTQSTTYYIETISNNGCINIDSTTVTVIPVAGPVLDLSTDTTVCLRHNIGIKILNYNSNYDYLWDVKDQGLDCYIECQSVQAQPLKDTYYSLIARNMYGCTKEDSILVKVESSIPDFLVSNKGVCEGENITIGITGGLVPLWDANPALSCLNCPNPTVNPTNPDYYYVNVQSQFGCQYRDSVFVDVISQSSTNAGIDRLICRGEEIQLSGKAIGSVVWSNDQNPSIVKNQLSIQITPTTSTIYILKSTYDECILIDSVLISVLTKTDVTVTGDTICPNDIGLLTAAGNSELYQWYDNGKKIGTGDSLTLKADHTMNIEVIGSKGKCITDTANVQLIVHPEIDYRLLEDSYEVFINTKAKVVAEYDKNANCTYEWSPSSGLSCDDCPEPEIQSIDQNVEFQLLVTDEFGCQIEPSIRAKFSDECSKKGFYIPNIFTPYSSPGTNDLFRVYAEEEGEFISISIFDRWGARLYTSTNINETWDGIYKGRHLSHGVYTYIITARCSKTNEIFNFGGDVTIIE